MEALISIYFSQRHCWLRLDTGWWVSDEAEAQHDVLTSGNSELIRTVSVKLPQNAEQKMSQVRHLGSKELPSGVIFLFHNLAINMQSGSINTNWRQKSFLLSKTLLQVDSLKP